MQSSSTAAETGRSRSSARGAVVGGAIVELLILSLLMMLAGGAGRWRTRTSDAPALSDIGSAFAICAGVSWILEAFMVGFVASIASRSITLEDGMRQGLLAVVGDRLPYGRAPCVYLVHGRPNDRHCESWT